MTVEGMLVRLEEVRGLFVGEAGFDEDGLRDFEKVIEAEVGLVRVGGIEHRWVAPKGIYHVLADSLAPSAEMSLFLGLLTGAKMRFKVPRGGLPRFEVLVSRVRERLGEEVVIDLEWDREGWGAADTVVVFGGDETVAHFRGLARPWQRFVAYGHKISGARVAKEDAGKREWWERARTDFEAYEQTGCLSPQVYWLPDEASAGEWVGGLTALLREYEKEMGEVTFEQAAAVGLARDRCRLMGGRVHAGDRCKWTVAEVEAGNFFVGPGCRFVQVVVASDLRRVLGGARGHWSAVGVSSGAWDEVRGMADALAGFGVSRVCEIGRMQAPCLGWRHDGGLRLAELGRWLTIEDWRGFLKG